MRSRPLLLLLGLVLSACAVVSPRQTLAVLGDGTVVYSEGRKEVCVALEDADGVQLDRVCDLEIDPLAMGEAALFPVGDRVVLVAVLPLDVAEVQVLEPGTGVVEMIERIESDITTGFAVAELAPTSAELELVGLAEDGSLVGRSPTIVLPTDEAVRTTAG